MQNENSVIVALKIHLSLWVILLSTFLLDPLFGFVLEPLRLALLLIPLVGTFLYCLWVRSL